MREFVTRFTKEGIILLILSVVLLTGIIIGAVRHAQKGRITFEAIAEKPVSVNVNEASAGELTVLPGIGEELASRIVAYRSEHGAFLCPESLLNVSGIGQTKLEKIKPFIEVP